MHDKTICSGIVEVFTQSMTSKTTQRESGLYPGISWEIIDLQRHMHMIYEWVHLPYAKTFWQMDHLSFEELFAHYEQLLNTPNAISLIGSLRGNAMCQVELYDCMHDEISQHYPAAPGDIGLHFLMAPLRKNKMPGVSLTMMRSILSLLLDNDHVSRVMGEPDVRNDKANALVRKAGFHFLKTINMSYKQANLYQCTRDTFFK